MRQQKIILTGGGTGGHVFPAIAMALELKRRGHSVTYIGSARGFEARHVPEKGIRFLTIQSGAIKNQGLIKILLTVARLTVGYLHSILILVRWRPAAVIGVGGYVSVPVCLAAVTLRIPLYLQEQNVSVGIANRFLGRFAKRVFLGFEQAKVSFPPGRTQVTGNPIRSEFFENDFAYSAAGDHLLILGGSQGANAINSGIVAILDRVIEHFPRLHIVHQTGERDLLAVKHAYEEIFPQGQFEVTPFIGNIVSHYRKASLVIARSGALTVSEILQVRRPAIFVPYPRKGQNDQTANAFYLQDLGVAQTVEQGDNFPERLWSTLKQCLSTDILTQMHGAFSGLRPTNALVSICDQIEPAAP